MSRRITNPTVRPRVALAVLLMAIIGCTSVKNVDLAKWMDKSKEAKTPITGTPKLEVAGTNLGESQEVSLTSQDLLVGVTQLVEAKRLVTAHRWIQRHPEAALDTLRKSGTIKGNAEALLLVAQVHDKQTIKTGASGWTQVISLRTSEPKRFEKFDQLRAQWISLIAEGAVDRALKLDLPTVATQTGQPLLEVDARQLQATALVLAEKPGEAIAAWEQALAAATQVSSHQSAYIQLLLSDAQRRHGDHAAAVAGWIKAANTSAQLLSFGPVLDPVLWERLAFLRPVQVQWPGPVVQTLRACDSTLGVQADGPGAPETCLWNAVGSWYLDRGHHQAALLSFKRAEGMATMAGAQAYLRFRQARCLALLDQVGAATAVLVTIASDKQSPMMRPAMGMLGSLRLQSGSLPQGLNLLRKSVEGADTVDWPDRPQAEADLGLAYLMVGDETQGFKWLHQAQKRFEARGDFESLTLALENEAGFFTQAKKNSEATALRERIAQLETSK